MLKIVWKFKQNMAKSHKTCMEQAEIIDTFGTYQVPGAAQPLAAPPALQAGSHTPWCPTLTPIYSPDEETPEQESLFQSTSWSRRHPLFFSGRANLEAALASGEGKSSPSSSPSPLHHPSMISSLMCE